MNKDNLMDGDDLDMMMEAPKLEVYKETKVSNRYRVFIDEEICGSSYYRNVINILSSAGEDDVVEFRLNTVGGQVHSAIQMLNAISSTEARTVAIIDGLVASAGTLFVLACDDVIIKPLSVLMVHSPATVFGGPYGRLKDEAVFNLAYLHRITHEIYEGFMTEDEIAAMLDENKEFWMGEDEVYNRLAKRQKYIEQQMKEIQEKAAKPAAKRSRKNAA